MDGVSRGQALILTVSRSSEYVYRGQNYRTCLLPTNRERFFRRRDVARV